MVLLDNYVGWTFKACALSISARRLWEHTQMGQINPFASITPASAMQPQTFVDVVDVTGTVPALTGVTLADLLAGKHGRIEKGDVDQLLRNVEGATVRGWLTSLGRYLREVSEQRAVRNQPVPFLPPTPAINDFGVPFVHSTLKQRLRGMGKTKAKSGQWLGTIQNFQKSGLRTEELDRSQLMQELMALDDSGEQATATVLVGWCDFQDLRMSVIPLQSDAQRQLRFTSAPTRTLLRTKKLPKALVGLARDVVGFDPVLGYRIEQVEFETLWGPEHHWQAVTHRGSVIRNVAKQALFPKSETAEALAASHAKQHFPKRMALGKWRHYAWTGGKDYTEWLITLPYYPSSFFSSHFSIRNVIAHVRCDVREGADGEQVLLLHEVQSDWAQSARRDISCGEMELGDDACPPFLKEWPALVMKLVVLHAVSRGLDAVAWTRGAHQVFRFKGLGATGLNELYDRTLPREVNRMIKTFGGVCETLGVFVPTNFAIKQSENGYEVYTAENVLLATAPTLEDARQFVPDQAHELLYEVHGVKLTEVMRREILAKGFPAWG
jgi:hypothetical protein